MRRFFTPPAWMSGARVAVAASAVVAILAVAGCFSDRVAGATVDASGCGVQLPSEAFGSTLVIIRNFAFTPAQVSVRPGTKVTWVNCGAQGTDSHTSTSDAGGWSSSLLAPGGTFTRVFPAAGVFPYHCELHPAMRGTVTLE